LRSLQNVNGDGVAVSSRGISISNKKRRAIPVEAPGFTYTGPFRAKIVDGGGDIQVGKADEVPAGLQDDYFIVDGGFDAMVDDLSFNTVSAKLRRSLYCH
jgi:hypothetical protein